jgi:hypothetical protein
MGINEDYNKARMEYDKQCRLLGKHYRPLVNSALKDGDLDGAVVIIDSMPPSVQKSLMVDMLMQHKKKKDVSDFSAQMMPTD